LDDGPQHTLALVALLGSALLLLLELGLTIALVAASALSRVALQRLSAESGGRLDFVVELKTPPTTHHSAVHLARQACLLGSVLLLALAARSLGWAYPAVFGVAVGALIGAFLIEAVLARSLALRDPRSALRLTSPLVVAVHALLYPITAPLNGWFERTSRGRQSSDDDRDEAQDEEVEALIEVAEREGILEADEGKMMRSIADLDETLVREIMTPRTDIVSLPIEASVVDARRVLIDSARSKVPVYSGAIDNVQGVLHARDLFRAWEEGKEGSGITGYLRPPLFVPETVTVAELLSKMRLKTRIAMVVDEYGGIAGLATLEDLLEEIVGDIRDEHDLEETLLSEQPDGTWLVAGVVHVKEVEDLFDVEIGDRDFDTVGGLVVAGFGRVPREGETLTAHGLQFDVLQSNTKRIYRVRVRRAQGGIVEADVAGG
jgi:magnesium and cobalt transporter